MTKRKGIILAGGTGSRLYPITHSVSKQLLPVYDKPMIYYPLSVLMLAQIREVAIISTPKDLPLYRQLLGDGATWGMKFQYIEQPSPDGIAQAFILAEEFLDGAPSALILGDNIFYGNGLSSKLLAASKNTDRATIFGYHVSDPERYGVIEFNKNDQVLSIVEKPEYPKSNFAITGLYFLGSDAPTLAKQVRPSERGELEITDVLNLYLSDDRLDIVKMGRGYAWLDTGTHNSLLDASLFIRAIDQRQNQKIGCLEELAYFNGWISIQKLQMIGNQYSKTNYGQYLLNIVDNEI